jgi:hypothetical protein
MYYLNWYFLYPNQRQFKSISNGFIYQRPVQCIGCSVLWIFTTLETVICMLQYVHRVLCHRRNRCVVRRCLNWSLWSIVAIQT